MSFGSYKKGREQIQDKKKIEIICGRGKNGETMKKRITEQ